MLEDRIKALFEAHMVRLDTQRHAQDVRFELLRSSIDHIESVLDQQRGARNLLMLIVGSSFLSLIISVIVLVTHA